MSTATAEFYGIRCDFPDCNTLYDDGEYTYWFDPYQNADNARDDGWLVDSEHNRAYCDTHVIATPCPTEGDDCEVCEEWSSDTHLTPMPDTWANRLRLAVSRSQRAPMAKLDSLERTLTASRYGHGPIDELMGQLDRQLLATWERAVVTERPDITPNELYQLRRSTERITR